jgi:hypothetical protein
VTDRLTFLGDQLASIDASLMAIDEALAAAGIKAIRTMNSTQKYELGNELMDRKGGGPVAWKNFYGAVAKDFYVEGRGGGQKQMKRPSQFKYVYRANNAHIDKAKQEVAKLEKTTDVLLARRRKLQSEQSMLWATLALEMVQNRDLASKSLYHWRLKLISQPDTSESAALASKQLDAMQSCALFLRTVDGAMRAGTEHLKTNQENVYTTLREVVREAAAPAEKAVLVYRDTVGESTSEGSNMVKLIGFFRGMQSQTRNVCDAYRQAATIDALKEEQREEELRGQLQTALFGFAFATSRLDDAVAALANEWRIVGDPGVELAGFNVPVFDSGPGEIELAIEAAQKNQKMPRLSDGATTPTKGRPKANPKRPRGKGGGGKKGK